MSRKINYVAPTTEEVREYFSHHEDEDIATIHRGNFDLWLKRIRSEAWVEGFDEGHYLPHEDKNCDCKENPYE